MHVNLFFTDSYCKNTYEGKSNIEVLLPSCGIKPEDNVVPVACLVSNLKGHVGPLQWLKNGSPFETDNSFKPLKGDGGFFFGRGSLNISKESWNKEDKYTCQVKFMTENYIKNISKCSGKYICKTCVNYLLKCLTHELIGLQNCYDSCKVSRSLYSIFTNNNTVFLFPLAYMAI